VQEEIANHVVAAVAPLHGVIARPTLEAARHKAPEHRDAYDCLLLFYDYAANRSPEAHLTIRDALLRHTQAEPGVASLWAALSFAHTDTWRFGFNVQDSREAARDRAWEAALTAVRLDPSNSLGYHALFLACFARGDMKGFREAGNRCLELNPNEPDSLADYGLHLTFIGQQDVGMLLLKKSLALNPEPPDWLWFAFF